MYTSVSPYVQSTFVCQTLDTKGHFVRNFRHTNQSACGSTELISLKYTEVFIILKHKKVYFRRDGWTDGGVNNIPIALKKGGDKELLNVL